MARKIVITSGKGGVGKTSIVANLGLCLAAMGKRVVLCDMDFGLNNLDIVLGLENKIMYDMADAVDGRCRPKQALVQCDAQKNLYILASGHGFKRSVTSQNVKAVINSFDKIFDYILIDCPAGIDTGFHRAVSSADEAIVVVTPHISSLRDADKVIGMLKSYRLDNLFLVVNMVRGDLVVDGSTLSPEQIESVLKVCMIGVIPDDDKVLLCVGGAVGKSGKAFKMLANNIEKGTNKIYRFRKGYEGFWGSIKRGLKRSL